MCLLRKLTSCLADYALQYTEFTPQAVVVVSWLRAVLETTVRNLPVWDTMTMRPLADSRTFQEVMDWWLLGIFDSMVINQPSTTRSAAAMSFTR